MNFRKIPYCIFGLAFLSQEGTAATIFEWEPLPYFSEEDSPFIDGIRNGSIYLEDFKDQELNTPFVTAPTNLGFFGETFRNRVSMPGPRSVWSVDGDDGLLDGNVFSGDTWITITSSGFNRAGEMQFDFAPESEGRYPNFVGIVITGANDVDQNVELSARDSSGQLLDFEGDYDPKDWNPPGGAIRGDPRTHRFIGFYAEDGISEFYMFNVFQVDHLQYGYAIPEPSTALLIIGTFPFVFRRRRSQMKSIS